MVHHYFFSDDLCLKEGSSKAMSTFARHCTSNRKNTVWETADLDKAKGCELPLSIFPLALSAICGHSTGAPLYHTDKWNRLLDEAAVKAWSKLLWSEHWTDHSTGKQWQTVWDVTAPGYSSQTHLVSGLFAFGKPGDVWIHVDSMLRGDLWCRLSRDMHISRWWQLTTAAAGAFNPAAPLWVIAQWLSLCVEERFGRCEMPKKCKNAFLFTSEHTFVDADV